MVEMHRWVKWVPVDGGGPSYRAASRLSKCYCVGLQMEVIMPATRETDTRIQGHQNKYDIEYTSLRYTISLNGKVLKNTKLPTYFGTGMSG